MDTQKSVDIIRKAAEAIQFKPSVDINKVVRFRVIPSGAGNDKSCFTNWFFAGGDIRHVAAYCHYILWFAKHDDSFSLEQLKEMVCDWIRQPGEFCGYCGFDEFWKMVQLTINAIKQTKTKEDFIGVVDAMWLYASNLNAWLYHYLPWGFGAMLPIRDEKYFEEGLRLARLKN